MVSVADIEFVQIPAGTFDLGDSTGYGNEKPVVENVYIDAFKMSKYEITNSQFAQFLKEYGSDKVKRGEYKDQTMIYEYKWGVKKEGDRWIAQKGYENHPIVYVTWYGANEFCQHYGYQLPTEAQWEYAAKGGQNQKWAGTDDPNQLKNYAWYGESWNSGSTHPVGQKLANPFELHDMSGNVWEWCQDWYDANFYNTSASKLPNPKNDSTAQYRVLRGGSWSNDPNICRAANRNYYFPTVRGRHYGFRVLFPVRARTH